MNPRVIKRLPRRLAVETVPGQRAVLASWALLVAGQVLAGAAFAVVLGGVGAAGGHGSHPAAATVGWVLSWALGYAAVVFPAGVGVREAALIAVLGATAGTPELIAAAVAHRLATIVAEAAVIAATRLRRR